EHIAYMTSRSPLLSRPSVVGPSAAGSRARRYVLDRRVFRNLRRRCRLRGDERDAVDLDLADDQIGPDGRARGPRLREVRLVNGVHPGEILQVGEPDAAADDMLEPAARLLE